MRSPHSSFSRKHWFDRSDILMAAACGVLASASLLLIVPRTGTLLLEILAALVMFARASFVRIRQRKAAQLCLVVPAAGSRIRLPDRYELVFIIVVILSYGAIAAMLRAVRTPEILVRVAPLLVFAAGLFAKNPVLHALARTRNSANGRHRHAASMSTQW